MFWKRSDVRTLRIYSKINSELIHVTFKLLFILCCSPSLSLDSLQWWWLHHSSGRHWRHILHHQWGSGEKRAFRRFPAELWNRIHLLWILWLFWPTGEGHPAEISQWGASAPVHTVSRGLVWRAGSQRVSEEI